MKRETFLRLMQLYLLAKLYMAEIVVYAVCLLMVMGRFTVPSHGLSWPGTYEAAVHLWCGMLLGAWYVSRDKRLLYAVIAMSLVELLVFGLFLVTGRKWTV